MGLDVSAVYSMDFHLSMGIIGHFKVLEGPIFAA